MLRINTEETQIETLLNAPVAQAVELMSAERAGKKSLPFGRLARNARPRSELKTLREVACSGYIVREPENGSIEVEEAGTLLVPTKPALRELAKGLSLSLLNSNGNPFNTRQLGSQIISAIKEA